MKKENIITILIVIFLVLLGVWYVEKKMEKQERGFQVQVAQTNTKTGDKEDSSYTDKNNSSNEEVQQEQVEEEGVQNVVTEQGEEGNSSHNEETFFSNDVYASQPSYIKKMSYYQERPIVQLDIVSSVQYAESPEEDPVVVNKSTKIRNYRITDNTCFQFYPEPDCYHYTDTVQGMSVQDLVNSYIQQNQIVYASTDANGNLTEISFPGP